jgi:hypothetical protein
LAYGYLVLVALGFLSTVGGFVMLGSPRRKPWLSGIVFIGGICALIIGILLTCVPDFFAG